MKDEFNNVGTIKISEEVIANIANLAACEVDGVIKLTSKNLQGEKNLVANLKPSVKGVNVVTAEDGIELSLHLVVAAGCNVPEVAKRVQENVKESVVNMTGLNVKKVNAFVVGMTENKPEQAE